MDRVLNQASEYRLQDCQEETHIENKESKVLVINTGGNLFMVHSEKGYVAARGLAECLKKNVTLHDAEYATQLSGEWLVTPCTSFGKHIRYKILEFESLIDSSNIEIED